MLYNNPFATGVNLDVETIAAFGRDVEHSSGDWRGGNLVEDHRRRVEAGGARARPSTLLRGLVMAGQEWRTAQTHLRVHVNQARISNSAGTRAREGPALPTRAGDRRAGQVQKRSLVKTLARSRPMPQSLFATPL